MCIHCAFTRFTAGSPGGAVSAAPKRIAGYSIVRQIGSGGMGSIFEADDEKMKRRVALKVLSAFLSLSEKAERRFEREAWIAGKLDHPNLVKVYERGNWEGLSYYSMELVRGGSLYDVIQNMKRTGRDDRTGLVFGSREYIHWAIQQVIEAARGLDFAHRRGVIHRDVKPPNLLISEDLGMVKVTDFGIAIDTAGPRTTTEGKQIGTVAYMAPEQVLGRQAEITARTDVYALGVTLFELLTLELPFEGDTNELYLNAILTSEARRAGKLNAQVGRDLDIVLRKALEKDHHHRYESAAAFADDLENVLHFRPIVARPVGVGTRVVKWGRRKPIHAALTILLVTGVPSITWLGLRYVEQRQALVRTRIDTMWKEVRWMSQTQRNREAIGGATEILGLDPGHVMALRARAIAHANLAGVGTDGDHARLAVEDTNQIIAAAPDAAWPYRLKAFLLERVGRAQEVGPVAAEAERRRSATTDNDDLHFDGLLALESDDPQTALGMFTELSARRPNDPVTFVYLGLANRRLGRIEKAVESYRWALALNPDDFHAHLELGRLLTESGTLDQGASHLKRALELDPTKASIHEALAASFLAQGRSVAGERAAAMELFRRAEDAARDSLAIEPEQPWSLINLGASLLERNRLLEKPDPALLAEARDCYATLPAWKDDPPAYGAGLTNLCDTLIQLDDLDRALEVCAKVTEIQPDEAVGWYNLAGIHAQMHRTEEALAALAKDAELGDRDWQYLAADPWFEDLRSDPRFQRLIEGMRRAAEAP